MLAAVGCSKSPKGDARPTATASVSASPSASAAIPADVVKAICTSQFGGELASIEVYRRADGSVQTLELRPDITKVSHPPSQFFDLSGAVTATIPEFPVEPGSDEAKKWSDVRAGAVGDAKVAESIGCKGR